MIMAKEAKLTEKALVALQALKERGASATLAELNEGREDLIGASSLKSLNTRGLIDAVMTEFVCPECGTKAKRNVYSITEAGMNYEVGK